MKSWKGKQNKTAPSPLDQGVGSVRFDNLSSSSTHARSISACMLFRLSL